MKVLMGFYPQCEKCAMTLTFETKARRGPYRQAKVLHPFFPNCSNSGKRIKIVIPTISGKRCS